MRRTSTSRQRHRRRRWLGGFLSLALLAVLAGCSAAPPLASPTPDATRRPVFPEVEAPPDATAWERVVARVGAADGPDLQAALDAFALAFAPIPGTEEPPGEKERLHDGTLAVRWIRHFWESLTPEQQEFADALMRGESPPGAARRRAIAALDAGPPAPVHAAPVTGVTDWDSLGEEMRSVLAANFGRDLKATMTVVPVTTMIDVDASNWDSGGWALPLDAEGEQVGAAATCTIYIHPDSLSLPPDQARALMAHEVFHCFEADLSTLASWAAVPPWVGEGAAEFASFEVTDGQAWGVAHRWGLWLSHPKYPLYHRSYDGHAIYYLLENAGVNPWTVMDQHLLAARSGTEAAYASLWQAGSDPFLNTWGSRYVMHDAPAAGNWRYVASGLNQLGLKFPPVNHQVTPGTSYTETADPYAAFLMFGRLLADVVVLETSGGPGIIRDRGDEYDLQEGASQPYCTLPGGCVCPEGSGGAGTEFRDIPYNSVIWIGMTGHLAGIGVTLLGFTLDDFCEQQPTNPPDAVECGLICAGSNGDPHLITVDGADYDFQAAGEFTLLRSPDGRFELQARQEPYQDSRSVSINTAVAIGLDGQRVAVYAEEDGQRLLVNGEEVAADEPVTAGGLSVRPSALGLEVAVAGQANVWVIGQEEWGLNLVVATSQDLREGALGLLGPVGDGQLPLLPDGSAPDAEDYRVALYEQLADGWAVTAEGSLFDYEDGAGPETFRDPSMPEPDAPLDFSELPLDLQQAGLEACASITEVLLREHCAFDVAITDDQGFLEVYEPTNALVVEKQVPQVPPGPGPEPGLETPAGADACGILSDAEIEEVTGFPVLSRAPGSPFDASRGGCQWELDRPNRTAHLWLEVHAPGGREEFESYMQLFSEPRLIPGLGDGALASTGNSIAAVKGDTWFLFDYSLLQPADEETLIELARIVLDRYQP